jgi:hypothetical protein
VRLCGLLCAALLCASPAIGQQDGKPAAVADVAPQATNAGAKAEEPITELRIECVDPSRALELIGKHACIAGRVLRVTSLTNGTTNISFHQPQAEKNFHAIVLAEDRNRVGDLSYLHGRVVVLLGDVTNHRGRPEIVVKDRGQLRVMAGNPPAEFDASHAKGTSAGQTTHSGRTRVW